MQKERRKAKGDDAMADTKVMLCWPLLQECMYGVLLDGT